MSESDNPFEPRMGRIRSGGRYGRAKSFLAKVSRAASKAGSGSGSRGRGQIGRAGASGYARRVVVKARFVKLSASSVKALAEHLRYIGRDSAVAPEDKGKLFGPGTDDADLRSFEARAGEDRYHFRLIVSPEDGQEITDLNSQMRELVSAMETDLGTRLDWVGAVHINTDHPHAHLVIRGRRDDGRDLVMPRRYISHGIRERAEDLVTRELGPETQYERDRKLAREAQAERLTRIDRSLERIAGKDGTVNLSDEPATYRQLNQTRLRKLERLGLATGLGKGRWRLASGFAATLKDLGERGDIIKGLHRAMRERPGRRLDTGGLGADEGAQPVIGQVVATGLDGPGHDTPFAVLDLADGRAVREAVSGAGDIKSGMIVEAKGASIAPKPSDRTVAEIAARHGGVYSAAIHQVEDPRAGAAFIAAHVRRLEALRRAGLVTREADGRWRVPADHLEKVARWQGRTARDRPVEFIEKGFGGLRAQIEAKGLSWLDETPPVPSPARGFGADLNAAIAERREHLRKRGLLALGEAELSPAARRTLSNLALVEAGRRAAELHGKPFALPPQSGKIEGRYVGDVKASNGKFAVIDRGRDVTLVPWRSVMEKRRGQVMMGMARGGRIDWQFARGKGR